MTIRFPSGPFLLVLFNDQPAEGMPRGFSVAQFESKGGECRLVELLESFPDLAAPGRDTLRLAASSFRLAANRYARREAQERCLPVWTAPVAGKGTP